MKHSAAVSGRQPVCSDGFTLIEILLVIVIILIATAVSVPLFRGAFTSAQMTDAVRSTVRMARYARSIAVVRQEICTLRFSEAGRITITCGNAATNTPDPAATNSAGPEISRRLPENIKISAFENRAEGTRSHDGNHTVRYYPSGMNDGFELTFRDEDDRQSTVTCNPVTGKTAVEDGR